MSATFQIPEQQAFNSLMGRLPELVMWGDMDHRTVGIHMSVHGERLAHLINKCAADFRADPGMKFLVMSNSAAACDGRIIERLEKALNQSPADYTDDWPPIELMPFTGDCGLMMKQMFLMESFCAADGHNNALLNIVGMPVTASANCGVSSKNCRQCYRYGPCPNWYDLVQEMGRVDCLRCYPRCSALLLLHFPQCQSIHHALDSHSK
jgi:hypothetical protein